MASIKYFEDIVSWQEARKLNMEIRNMIRKKKFETNFGLINQIERSAGSIMDNIAEGFERGGNKEFIHFLFIAKGSCGELRSQMYRAMDSGYIKQDEFDTVSALCVRVNHLIFKMIDYLQHCDFKGTKFKNQH
jgi:four helix bundle protein